jgi:hypothetical protein
MRSGVIGGMAHQEQVLPQMHGVKSKTRMPKPDKVQWSYTGDKGRYGSGSQLRGGGASGGSKKTYATRRKAGNDGHSDFSMQYHNMNSSNPKLPSSNLDKWHGDGSKGAW